MLKNKKNLIYLDVTKNNYGKKGLTLIINILMDKEKLKILKFSS